MYMVHLIDIENVQLLATICMDLQQLEKDPNYIPKWLGFYLLFARDMNTPLSRSTHYKDTTRLFRASE
jgi:hypothetical protein